MIIGICKACEGFVRANCPAKNTPDGIYHDHCYDRKKNKTQPTNQPPKENKNG